MFYEVDSAWMRMCRIINSVRRVVVLRCDRTLRTFLIAGVALWSQASPLSAADITVTTNADSGAGSLRQAIIDANAGDRILFASSLAGSDTITLATMLPLIDKNLEIDGSANANLAIDGNNANRAFFVRSGTVSISNLTIQDVSATGGAGGGDGVSFGGGGGGLGAGAAVFVDSAAVVTVSNVAVSNSAATGGAGGVLGGTGGFGGGGGLGGDGGSSTTNFGNGGGGGGGGLGGDGGTGGSGNGGGGGGGITGTGGNGAGAAPATAGGLADGGGGGGSGAFTAAGAGSGGAGNGGPGNNLFGPAAGSGGGGASGGISGSQVIFGTGGAGGLGAYGGGGGGGTGGGNATGGAGGFGGGAGGGGSIGGTGGFGGGGGFGGIITGAGGAYGGAANNVDGGGGGAALGGAIFVRSGGTLNLVDTGLANSSVTGGQGGGTAGDGQALGAALFLHDVNLGIQVTGTNTVAITDSIADNSGAVGGSASALTKTGTGALTLNGANIYTGDTNVDAGRLAVNGSVTSDVNVALGATLGGNGTVTGDVNNSGTVGAGNSIGTLSVVGNYNSLAGSTTEVEIAPGGNTPGTHNDLIAVTGAANLNGNGTVSVLAAPGAYTANTTYTFLTTTAGVNGTFAGITDDLAMFNAVLVYDPFNVSFRLVGNGTSFGMLGATPNQQAVGMYLDAVGPGSGPFGAFLTAAGLGTAADIRASLTQLQGQIYATMPMSQLQLTSQNLQMLRNQLVFAPACRGGETATGWVRGYGSGASNDADSNAAGYHLGIGGTEAAVQRCVDDGTAIGAFGNFGWSTLKLDTLAERATINSNQFGVYYQEVVDRAYLLGVSGFGFQDADVTRTLSTFTAQGQARANLDGWQHFDYFELGGRLNAGRLEFRPFVAGQYIYYRQNGTTETGTTPVNLAVGGQDISSYRTYVGGAWGVPLEVLTVTIAPQLRAAWMHEYGDAVYNSQNALIGAGAAGAGGFTITGARAGRDFLVVGTGLNVALTAQASLTLAYDAQLNDRQAYQTGSGGLQYVW
jgi:uncharacterized protein with beta-barrel porin domain